MGQRSINFRFRDIIVAAVMGTFPKLSKLLGLQFYDAEQSAFYRSLVLDTMRHREAHNVVRPDMIQLLMAARNGTLNTDGSVPVRPTTGEGFAVQEEHQDTVRGQRVEWTEADLTAQCFLFFIAGFETSSLLMSVAAQELAENQEVQTRLRAEVDQVVEALDGTSLSYDALQGMKYMDMVVSGKFVFFSRVFLIWLSYKKEILLRSN